MRRALALLLLVLAAACAPSRAALRPGDAARLGEPLDLAGLDAWGQRRTVAELAAGRPVLVSVWATWCRSCRPALAAWEPPAKRFGGRVAVVAVSIDEDRRQIPGFVKELSLTYPVLWDRGGREALSRLALEKVPTLLVLDRSGRLRHVHEGWSGKATAEAVEAQLAALLDADPAPAAP